jgi:hypothetical protein
LFWVEVKVARKRTDRATGAASFKLKKNIPFIELAPLALMNVNRSV